MRTEAGKRVALGERYFAKRLLVSQLLIVRFPDGFYRISSAFDSVAHVWFSHSLLKGQSSTYIIHGCPEIAKNLILSYVDRINSTIRPLSIDAIFSNLVYMNGDKDFPPLKISWSHTCVSIPLIN